MPVIRSISDLRNKANEVSELCHETDEPVFITKNGVGDMVIMSMATFERDRARLELYDKLQAAEDDIAAGDKGVSVRALRKRLKR